MGNINITDLKITYSYWKDDNERQYILPPLVKSNIPLHGIQIKSKFELTRMDFEIIENDNLIFHDLFSGNKYGLDFSELNNGKIHFIGENGLQKTWNRILIEQSDIHL
jgi:hypothetical protein